MSNVDASLLRKLLEKATPAPWDFGGWSGRCHKVHDPRGGRHPGPPECVYEAEWHEPYCGKHEIASRSKPDAMVAGNYACEEGGIINDADADLIVALRNNAGALLDELASLQSRLAAAEAEAARARGLLGEAMVALMSAGRFAKLASRIEHHLASRPEGEVRHG